MSSESRNRFIREASETSPSVTGCVENLQHYKIVKYTILLF